MTTSSILDTPAATVHPHIETTGSAGVEPDRFDSWAIVELFGHKKIAGRVTEQTLGGGAFIRVDVPETKHFAAYTKLLGNGAIYAITPVDETIARRALEYINADPIPVYIPPDRQLGAGDQHSATAAVATDGREDDDDDFEDRFGGDDLDELDDGYDEEEG